TSGAVRNAWLGRPVATFVAALPTTTPALFTPHAMLERQLLNGGGTSVPRSSANGGNGEYTMVALNPVRNACDTEPHASGGTFANPTTCPASLMPRAPLSLKPFTPPLGASVPRSTIVPPGSSRKACRRFGCCTPLM